MKILTLMGSPKREGNTATVLRMFEDRVSGDHEVERVDVTELNVTGCRGCYACAANTDAPGCVLPDDARAILDRIVAADAVVYATPLYMWGVASDLRALMERHLSLVKGYGTPGCKSLVEGKKAAFIVTCGGPVEGNADAIQDVLRRFAAYAKVDVAGIYVLPNCTSPDALGDEAEALAARIAAAVAS